MRIRKIATLTTLAPLVAMIAVGCTSMHKAGSLAGVDPSCGVPTLREQGCGVPEPGCAAPEGGYVPEPTCAAPGGYGHRAPHPGPAPAGPCPCATCAQQVHEHVHAPPPPKPQGDLAFGGGALTFPLPIFQLPGCFRVPGVRSALLPVAEPILVETPVAPAPVVTGSSAIVQTAAVVPTTVVPTVTGSAGVVERVPIFVVDRQRTPDVTGSSGQTDEPRCLCDEELDAFLEAVRARLQQSGVSGSSGQVPTPAPTQQRQIDELRQSADEAQKALDEIEKAVDEALKQAKAQQAAGEATP